MIFNFDNIYYPSDVTERIHENADEKMIDHIRRANIDHMDETAMTYMGITITYRELFAHIEAYARALKKYGLNKGDFMTICLPNSPETIYYFYACNEIGVTPYLIDPRCVFGKMKTCILDSNSKLFICEMGTYFAKVAENENDLPVNNIVVVSPVNMLDESKKLPLKLKVAKMLFSKKKKAGIRNCPGSKKRIFQREFILAGKNFIGEYKTKYDPQIPAIVVNTSGTSGDSVKGAVHTNKSYNILSNQTDFISSEIKRGYSYYGYIPYFSMYGSGVGMHTGLSHGVVINNIPTFSGKKSVKEILSTKQNILIGVPSLYEALALFCKKHDVNMSFAKLYVMGGDNISPDKLQEENNILAAQGMKTKITYGYGATEIMMANTNSDDERSFLYGSCGIPYPNVDYIIMDPENGVQLPYDVEGEIYIHTSTLMLGYLNKPEENKKVFIQIDGKRFFKTGDKGYLTKSGHLFLTGRYKRLMKRPDGHQVSPIPIENAICKLPFVKECAVIGIKKGRDLPGVIPTAFVRLNVNNIQSEDGAKKMILQIAINSLNELSGEREMALAYRVVDSIPITENGKMDYRSLENNDFESGKYFAIDDPITRDYFKGMSNVSMIKINK